MAIRLVIATIAAVIFSPVAILAQTSAPAPGEAWKSSPFHGVTNEATGKSIPCICRFQNRDFRLGESVCMPTHLGVVIAKCDLQLNNTTWAPTDQPCTLSAMTPVKQLGAVTSPTIPLQTHTLLALAAGD